MKNHNDDHTQNPDLFLYQACMDRVSDLNRTTFNYRVLFSTIVAGYFTALSFISGFAEQARVIPTIELYIITFIALTLASLVGMIIISFLDFIFQELTENALRCASQIELSFPYLKDRRRHLISRYGSSRITLRMSITVSLLYFVPICCLYVVLSFFSGIVILETSETNAAFAEVLCRQEEVFWQSYPKLSCLDKVLYDFSPGFVYLVSIAQIISAGFVSYFLFYCVWRCSVRSVEPTFRAVTIISDFVSAAIRRVTLSTPKRSDSGQSVLALRKLIDVICRVFGRLLTIFVAYCFIRSLLDSDFAFRVSSKILEVSLWPMSGMLNEVVLTAS